MRILAALFSLVLLMACETGTKPEKFDWQGHRGARGEAPENTIPAMLRALQEGVTTLEMDVVLSADSQVVVSHEPFINPQICLGPEGESLADSPLVNLYQLKYSEIAKFDCGSIGNPDFPSQELYQAQKPRLIDLIGEVEEAVLMSGLAEPRYSIEIKSKPQWEGLYQPKYQAFVDLVLQTLDKAQLGERLVIQSFDERVLRYLHEIRPEISLAYLVESDSKAIGKQFKELGFVPDIYSPYYKLLDSRKIKELKALKLKVVPWTVNDIGEAERLKQLGVDGIITDFPARMISALGA